jgi:hypothetical protein
VTPEKPRPERRKNQVNLTGQPAPALLLQKPAADQELAPMVQLHLREPIAEQTLEPELPPLRAQQQEWELALQLIPEQDQAQVAAQPHHQAQEPVLVQALPLHQVLAPEAVWVPAQPPILNLEQEPAPQPLLELELHLLQELEPELVQELELELELAVAAELEQDQEPQVLQLPNH